jgi:hypothetical protein
MEAPMTVHQCPKCELRFTHKTEVDDHCWHDHPEFRHEYPAAHHRPEPLPVHEVPVERPVAEHHAHIEASSFSSWLQPSRPRPRPARSDRQPPPQ